MVGKEENNESRVFRDRKQGRIVRLLLPLKMILNK